MNIERRELRSKERFWSRVNKTDTCWMWFADADRDGYGRFWYQERNHLAHRLSYLWLKGPINEYVLHTCDNPRCVNPEHLYDGTAQNNIDDAYIRGRKNDRGSNNGWSKLTEADVIQIRSLYERRKRGGMSQAKLAKTFGVNQAHVSDIVNRVVWKHV